MTCHVQAAYTDHPHEAETIRQGIFETDTSGAEVSRWLRAAEIEVSADVIRSHRRLECVGCRTQRNQT